jgi:hypothetical protein
LDIITAYAEKHAKKVKTEAAKKPIRVPKRRLDTSLYTRAQPLAEDFQQHIDETKEAEVKRLKVADILNYNQRQRPAYNPTFISKTVAIKFGMFVEESNKLMFSKSTGKFHCYI